MEWLTTFTRKSRVFQNWNYFFSIRSIRLNTVYILISTNSFNDMSHTLLIQIFSSVMAPSMQQSDWVEWTHLLSYFWWLFHRTSRRLSSHLVDYLKLELVNFALPIMHLKVLLKAGKKSYLRLSSSESCRQAAFMLIWGCSSPWNMPIHCLPRAGCDCNLLSSISL